MLSPESIILEFDPKRRGKRSPARELSAAARAGDTLFVAGDEGGSVELLHPNDDRTVWAQSSRIALQDLVPLPEDPGRRETDIESLAVDGDTLWIAGSHTLVRKKPDGRSPKQDLRDLGKIELRPNRFVLAAVPLKKEGSALVPVRAVGDRHAAMVEVGKRSSMLLRWLGEDPMLKPFLDLPAKENGFDIEGLAVGAGHVWLGLRGPVIRGHAVVIQLALSANRRDRLKARKLEGTRRFRKFLLPIGGLGIRDMQFDGDDILLLTGPTMSAPGPSHLWRWKSPAKLDASCVIDERRLCQMLDLTDPRHDEAPEGLANWDAGRLLILHDCHGGPRLSHDDTRYRADLMRIPGA